MDPHRHEDDLSEFERRLARWHPDAEGLDAAAMLFAAGHAAGRRGRGRFLWPTLCAALAVLAAGLGLWGRSEHAACRALADLLRERGPGPTAPPAPAVAVVPEPSDMPSPGGQFSLRRQLEQDPNCWLAALQPVSPQPPGPPPPEPAILRGGQWDELLNP
jgi:hypothetical protein